MRLCDRDAGKGTGGAHVEHRCGTAWQSLRREVSAGAQKVVCALCYVNGKSLGLSNATEEQQVYSVIRGMPMLRGVYVCVCVK